MARGNYLRSIWCGKLCVFCGGGTPATTADHVPPKVMFLNQDRPRGMEVPSCARCNSGRSQWDQIAANIATMSDPEIVLGEKQLTERCLEILKGMVSNLSSLTDDGSPKLELSTMAVPILPSKYGANRVAAAAAMRLKEEILNGLPLWCAQQCLAYHYLETNRIVGTNARVDILLLPNLAFQKHGVENLVACLGPEKTLISGSKHYYDEFSYRAFDGERRAKSVVFAQYKCAFGFLGLVNEASSARFSCKTTGFRFRTNALQGAHRCR